MTQLVTQPSVLAINPALGVASVADLVALLKNNPAKYNFASIGNGSLSHLAMEAIAIKAGAQLMMHVPYNSSPQAIAAVIRSDPQITCLPAICYTASRSRGCQNSRCFHCQTLTLFAGRANPEGAGIDVEADAWNGLIAPGGTPKPNIDKISSDVAEIIKQPAVREKLAAQLMEPVGSSPEELRARMDGEIARWAPVIKAANIKLN